MNDIDPILRVLGVSDHTILIDLEDDSLKFKKGVKHVIKNIEAQLNAIPAASSGKYVE
jgi:hypothetical protein